MRQILLDTETTGLSNREHRIVSLAAVEMVDGELTGRFAHYHLNPERPCDPGAAAIHGLTDEYLATQPKFHEIIEPFDAFIDNSPLIIHNAVFDLGFLEAEYDRVMTPLRQVYRVANPTRCTLSKAKAMRGWGKGVNTLDTLARDFKVQNLREQTGKHGALVDCLVLFGVYRALHGASPLPLVQSQIDHYLSRGFGIHGNFPTPGEGSADVLAPQEPDATTVPTDVRASGG